METVSAQGKEANKNHLKWKTSEVVSGFCKGDCGQLVGYVVTLALVVAVASTGKMGTLIILLRSVEPRDKAMMLGLFTFVLSLAAFIPSQLIFGAAIDSSCLVWKENCGEKSNCAFYNSQRFRYFLHSLAAGFLSLAAIFDVVVYFKARNMKLYEVSDKKSFEMSSVKEVEEVYL